MDANSGIAQQMAAMGGGASAEQMQQKQQQQEAMEEQVRWRAGTRAGGGRGGSGGQARVRRRCGMPIGDVRRVACGVPRLAQRESDESAQSRGPCASSNRGARGG